VLSAVHVNDGYTVNSDDAVPAVSATVGHEESRGTAAG